MQDCRYCDRTFDTLIGLRTHEAHTHGRKGICGRPGTYNNGCRCDDCREAHRRHNTRQRRKQGARPRHVYVAERRRNAAGHGTDSRYKRGCRCSACKRSHADYERESRKRRLEGV